MTRQRKVVITTTYNELGIIIDTKAEEVAQPNLQPTCNQLVTDTISRQAAIRWVKTECNPYGKPTLEFESGKKVIEHLEQMPSVQPETCAYWDRESNFCTLHRPYAQPERKPGRWIPYDDEYYECSVCGVLWVFNDGTPEENEANFCPKCGADLRGGSHVKYD